MIQYFCQNMVWNAMIMFVFTHSFHGCFFNANEVTQKIIANSTVLKWRHNGRDGISNYQPHKCLLNCLYRHISKQTSKLRVTGLCALHSPVTGEFPAQMVSNAENVSIWWGHHRYQNYNKAQTVDNSWYAQHRGPSQYNDVVLPIERFTL